MVQYPLSYVHESVVVDILAKPSVLIKPENGKFNLRCQPLARIGAQYAYRINYEPIKRSNLDLFAENMEAFEPEDDIWNFSYKR